MRELTFLEKQYFGLNKMSLAIRILLAIFCFIAFYWRENHEKSGEVFFFIGLAIMLISIFLFFILHFKTEIINGSIILDGLWTARKVKINVKSLASVEKIYYSKYILNRAVYNLHVKGTIRFYTRGTEAVKIVDKDGLIYLIGSQKADQLKRVIQNNLN